jgi:hypothetical protein
VRCQCLQPGSPGVRHCKTAQELNVPVEIIMARKGPFETQNVFFWYFLHIHVHEMTLLQTNPSARTSFSDTETAAGKKRFHSGFCIEMLFDT